jgi:hypothetical protein
MALFLLKIDQKTTGVKMLTRRTEYYALLFHLDILLT